MIARLSLLKGRQNPAYRFPEFFLNRQLTNRKLLSIHQSNRTLIPNGNVQGFIG